MHIKQRLDQDLKSALLGGNKLLATTLRGLKSVILYAEVAEGRRDKGLTDQEIVALLRKELKKRYESAELYQKGGSEERQQAEIAEAEVIKQYLPQEITGIQLDVLIDDAISEIGPLTQQSMGKVIGKVKELSGGSVDGGRIAEAVKARMK